MNAHSKKDKLNPFETMNKMRNGNLPKDDPDSVIEKSDNPFPLDIRCNPDKLDESFKRKLDRGDCNCSIIRQKYKGKDQYVINFDDLNLAMAVDISEDCRSFRYICEKKYCRIVDENDKNVIQKVCDINFIPRNERIWEQSDDNKMFFSNCRNLPEYHPQIVKEEDKAMWKTYLEGLNALLDSKKELIKIQSVSTWKDGTLKLILDKEFLDNKFKKRLEEILKNCETKANVSVSDNKCLIDFDGYQYISDEIKDKILFAGKEYGYGKNDVPRNTVKGKIMLIPYLKKYDTIVGDIKSELSGFDGSYKYEDGGFQLSSDSSVDYVKKIVNDRYRNDVEVKIVTSFPLRLKPAKDIEHISALKKFNSKKKQGEYVVVDSKTPIAKNDEVFSSEELKFVKAKLEVSVKKIDESVSLEGAKIRGNTYLWEFHSLEDMNGGRFYEEVKKNYQGEKPSSSYFYTFLPVISQEDLQQLKMDKDGVSVKVDVPDSRVDFTPKIKEEYDKLIEDFRSGLKDIKLEDPKEYRPTIRIEYSKKVRQDCSEMLEKVKEALKDLKDIQFPKNDHGEAELLFEFNFDAPESRDEFESKLKESMKGLNAEIEYGKGRENGYTEWSLIENPTLLEELNQNLRSDFNNEEVKYITSQNYKKYQEFIEKSDDVKQKNEFLEKHSQRLGKCKERNRDTISIKSNEDSNDVKKNKGNEVDEEVRKKEKGLGDKNNHEAINKGDYVLFPMLGETAVLKRQQQAMERILYPQKRPPINQKLSNFLFDPRFAKEIENESDIEKEKEDIRKLVGNKLNDTQIEATAKASLAEDFAIIQGPPGTGKTTVIATIIRRIISRYPDSRILLTSQTHLAVDNALERLQGEPGIFSVRVGKEDRMEPEGKRCLLQRIDSWAGKVTEETRDNVVERWLDMVRKKASNDPTYQEVLKPWTKELEEKSEAVRKEFVEEYKKNINLIAATCSECGSKGFDDLYKQLFGDNSKKKGFDVVIMDEASKATPLEMSVPLVLGKKVILVGDHKQLPSIMDEDTIDSSLEKIGRKDLAKKLREEEPQYKKLFLAAKESRQTLVATLDTQYRMHKDIQKLIEPFYEEDGVVLKCGLEETMNIRDLEKKGSRWHGIMIEGIINPDTHAVWINVDTPETALKPGYENDGEVDAIVSLLKLLRQSEGYKAFVKSQEKQEDKEIGLITFYTGQKRKIMKRCKNSESKDCRINVVDRFQGMERNIVIVSTVRSNPENNIGFAKEIERINVAFSRARRLLIVVGNKKQFENDRNYAKSIANMKIVEYDELKAIAK